MRGGGRAPPAGPPKPPPTTTTRCRGSRVHAATASSAGASSPASAATKSRSRISTNETTAAAKETIAPTSKIVFRPSTSAERAVVGDEAAQRCGRRRDRLRRAAGRDRVRERVRVPRRAASPLRRVDHRCAHLGGEDRAEPGDTRRDADLAERRVDARGHARRWPARQRRPRSRSSGVLTRPPPSPLTIIPASRCVQSELGVRPRMSMRPAPISRNPARDQQPTRHAFGEPAGDAGGNEDRDGQR